VKNIDFKEAEVIGNYNVGILAGMIQFASIEDVRIKAAVISATESAGALTGVGMMLQVNHIYTDVVIQATDISTDLSMAGGIIGSGLMIGISESYATGVIAGSSSIGGLVGEVSMASNVDNSYSDADVSGQENI